WRLILNSIVRNDPARPSRPPKCYPEQDMWHRLAWVSVVALLMLAPARNRARANGRPPATVSSSFAAEPPGRLLVGTTFGLVLSDDGGTSWRWVCESSIYAGGRIGTFDPVYRSSASGTLYAALESGLSISRDGGCTWELARPLGGIAVMDL